MKYCSERPITREVCLFVRFRDGVADSPEVHVAFAAAADGCDQHIPPNSNALTCRTGETGDFPYDPLVEMS